MAVTAAVRVAEQMRIDLNTPGRALSQQQTPGVVIVIEGAPGTEPQVIAPPAPMQIEGEVLPEREFEQPEMEPGWPTEGEAEDPSAKIDAGRSSHDHNYLNEHGSSREHRR
jgi:hypothetical protein